MVQIKYSVRVFNGFKSLMLIKAAFIWSKIPKKM